MNVNTYEKLMANPVVADKVASATFYAIGKASNPHFTALWAEVLPEEKEKAAQIGFQAILAIVDDYTTPGCKCKHCTWKKQDTHGKPIMCRQRWDRLSPDEQRNIAESCAG